MTWVGIDGYYYHPSTAFSSLFGPTIAAVRQLTGAPILIAETAAVPARRASPRRSPTCSPGSACTGCSGFVWFDVTHPRNWRLSSPEALAAFRRERDTADYRSARPPRLLVRRDSQASMPPSMPAASMPAAPCRRGAGPCA